MHTFSQDYTSLGYTSPHTLLSVLNTTMPKVRNNANSTVYYY